MDVGSDGKEIQDLFLFDEDEKVVSQRNRMPVTRSAANVFEELKIKMVMRIYGISRDIAKRYIARRMDEVDALQLKRAAEAKKLSGDVAFGGI